MSGKGRGALEGEGMAPRRDDLRALVDQGLRRLDPQTRRLAQVLIQTQLAGASTAATLMERWCAAAADRAVAATSRVRAAPDDLSPADRVALRVETLLDEHRRLMRYATTLPQAAAFIFLSELVAASRSEADPVTTRDSSC